MLKTALIATLAIAAAPACAADLTIRFSGSAPADGPVMVAVHDNATSFDNRTGTGIAMVMAPPGVAAVTIAGLPPGRYAVKAYLDANGDRALNVGADGRPTEKVAVSGQPAMGWPTFSTAAMAVEDSTVISLGFAKP